MLSTIVERNEGSYYDVSCCLRQAIPLCLPVICIDNTFLTGKYKSQILTVIGMDDNHQNFISTLDTKPKPNQLT
jgi:hypothetical protein